MIKLTKDEEAVLIELHQDSEQCVGYNWLSGTKEELKPIIKKFKELDLIEFHRGLMTEEGEVAGSGWCRSPKGNEYVEENQL